MFAVLRRSGPDPGNRTARGLLEHQCLAQVIGRQIGVVPGHGVRDVGEGAREADAEVGAEGGQRSDILRQRRGEVPQDGLMAGNEGQDLRLDATPLPVDREVGLLDAPAEVEAEQDARVQSVGKAHGALDHVAERLARPRAVGELAARDLVIRVPGTHVPRHHPVRRLPMLRAPDVGQVAHEVPRPDVRGGRGGGVVGGVAEDGQVAKQADATADLEARDPASRVETATAPERRERHDGRGVEVLRREGPDGGGVGGALQGVELGGQLQEARVADRRAVVDEAAGQRDAHEAQVLVRVVVIAGEEDVAGAGDVGAGVGDRRAQLPPDELRAAADRRAEEFHALGEVGVLLPLTPERLLCDGGRGQGAGDWLAVQETDRATEELLGASRVSRLAESAHLVHLRREEGAQPGPLVRRELPLQLSAMPTARPEEPVELGRVQRLGAKRRLVQGLIEGRPRGRDRPDAALGQVEAHARVVGEVVVAHQHGVRVRGVGRSAQQLHGVGQLVQLADEAAIARYQRSPALICGRRTSVMRRSRAKLWLAGESGSPCEKPVVCRWTR